VTPEEMAQDIAEIAWEVGSKTKYLLVVPAKVAAILTAWRDEAVEEARPAAVVMAAKLLAENQRLEAEHDRLLAVLKDSGLVWTAMLRGEIARPRALDHYEECKARAELVGRQYEEVVNRFNRFMDSGSDAGEYPAKMYARHKSERTALAASKEDT
jgi:hypothetical protein